MHHAVNEFKNKSRDPNSHTTLGTYPLIWKTPPSIDSILILEKLITKSISSDKINFASYVNKEAGRGEQFGDFILKSDNFNESQQLINLTNIHLDYDKFWFKLSLGFD